MMACSAMGSHKLPLARKITAITPPTRVVPIIPGNPW
jgi:hypothetical protein